MQSLIGDSGIWAYTGSNSDDVFNVKDTTGTVPRLNVAVMLREPARLLQYYIQVDNYDKNMRVIMTDQDTMGDYTSFMGDAENYCTRNLNIENSVIEDCDHSGQYFNLHTETGDDVLWLEKLAVVGTFCNEDPPTVEYLVYDELCAEFSEYG